MKPVDQYLQLYADPLVNLLDDFPVLRNTVNALAIPCYDEEIAFLERLQNTRFESHGNLLVVVVVNQPAGQTCPRNQALLHHVRQHPVRWKTANLSLFAPHADRQYWLVIDACDPGLPAIHGVGAARKMAADVVLALRHHEKIGCTWLHCSDADAYLPSHYFRPLDDNASATMFDFRHRDNPDSVKITSATRLYEQALHYYVDGLRWAGSPYAFYTIGSCLALNLRYYPLVRGFPVRAAAEDFYLLNKLAKLAPVSTCDTVTVGLESRVSTRVPFGTGPEVTKILELADPLQHYTYYSASCFNALRTWLANVPVFVQQQEIPQSVSPAMHDALLSQGIYKLIDHLQRQKLTGARAVQATHEWFDAFKTLKSIHYLQQHHFPAEPLHEILKDRPFQ